MADGTPRVGGVYEIVASDAGLVKNGVVPIRPAGQTRVVVKLMDQERLYRYLKRGDSTLMGLCCINDQAARTLLQIESSVRPNLRGTRYWPLVSFCSSSTPIRTRLAL